MAVKFPKISKFLCCINLDTGSLIVGLLTLLGAWTVFLGLALLEFKFGESEYDDETRLIALSIGLLLVPIASAALILLFGTMKRNPTMVCCYLWVDGIITLLTGATMICFIVLSALHGPTAYRTGLLIFIIAFVFKVYFFISVNSHYLDLVDHRDHPMFSARFSNASAPPQPIVPQSYLYPHIYYSQPE